MDSWLALDLLLIAFQFAGNSKPRLCLLCGRHADSYYDLWSSVRPVMFLYLYVSAFVLGGDLACMLVIDPSYRFKLAQQFATRQIQEPRVGETVQSGEEKAKLDM